MSSCCHCTPPAPAISPAEAPRPGRLQWFRLGLLVLLAGLTMSLSLALNLTPATGPARDILHALLAAISSTALAFGGWPIFKRSLSQRLNLEHLFLIGLLGTLAASGYSSLTGIGHIYYEIVLILLAIYHFGQLMLAAQIHRTADLSRHIPGLYTTATLVESGGTRTLSLDEIQPGQLLEISAGALIPADGVVESGSAFVEQSLHSGEPFPAPKHRGDSVLAGSPGA